MSSNQTSAIDGVHRHRFDSRSSDLLGRAEPFPEFGACDFDVSRTAEVSHDSVIFESPVTRMLLSSDGLTTTLLEAYSGEKIHVYDAVHHRVRASDGPIGAAQLLESPDDSEIIVRRSVLSAEDDRVFSVNHVVARLDINPAISQLFSDGALLGRALQAKGTGFRRTVLDLGRKPWCFDRARPAAFKTYLIWHDEDPLVAISEIFHPDLVSCALDPRYEGHPRADQAAYGTESAR